MFLSKKRKLNKEIINEECRLKESISKERIRLNEELNIEKLKIKNEIIDLKIQCAEQKGNAEHGYHSAKEQKNAELVRLDEKIKYREKLANFFDFEIKAEKEKNEKIISNYEFLVKTLKEENQKLLEKLSSVDVKEIVPQVITK